MSIIEGRIYRCSICGGVEVVTGDMKADKSGMVFIDPMGWWIEPDERKKCVCRGCVHAIGTYQQYLIQR